MLVYERPNRCSRGTGFTDEHDQNIQRSGQAAVTRRACASSGQPGGCWAARALDDVSTVLIRRWHPPQTSKTPDRPAPTMADAAAAPARGDEVSTQRHSPP